MRIIVRSVWVGLCLCWTGVLAVQTNSGPAGAEQQSLHSVTMNWSAVEQASHYQLQLRDNGPWQTVTVTAQTSFTLSELAAGDYQVRVGSCVEEPGVTIHCGEQVSDYSSPYDITLPLSQELPAPVVDIPTAPTLTPLAAYPQDHDDTSAQVATLPGAFRVDESGAASYSVPLSLPEGIAGNTPSLSLEYSSAFGNGPLGIGWRVSGLSSISRCRATYEQDGYDLQFTLTNADRYCLDGQKLIPIKGDNGADGTDYRTELDSRTRIISHGIQGNGPAYFTVEREDGSISYYGGQDIANTRDDALLLSDGTGVIWQLTSVSDNLRRADTSVYYHYTLETEGFGSNERLIDTVKYSGNQVVFDYDTDTGRTDLRDGYLLGVKTSSTARLESVEVHSSHEDSLLRRYQPSYSTDPVSGVERIAAITVCGAGGSACLPATQFDWYPQTALSHGSAKKRILSDDDDKPVVSLLPFDADGDGFNDLVSARLFAKDKYQVMVAYNDQGTLKAPQNLFTIDLGYENKKDLNVYRLTIIPSDIDGDGQAELLYYTRLGGQWRWQFYDFNDTTLKQIDECDKEIGECFITSHPSHIVDMAFTSFNPQLTLQDINGDAYPDAIMPTQRYLNDGTGQFTAEPIPHTYPPPLEQESSEYSVMPLYQALETYSEVFLKPDPETDISANNNNKCGNEEVVYATHKVKTLPNNLPPLDFNGDGVGDALVRLVRTKTVTVIGDDGEPEFIECQGELFWAAYTLEKPHLGDDVYGTQSEYGLLHVFEQHYLSRGQIYAGDINGDGLTDLLHPPAASTDSEYSIVYATGAKMSDAHPVTLGAQSKDIAYLQLLDVNGDQRLDVLYFDNKDECWEVLYQAIQDTFSEAQSLHCLENYDEEKDSLLLADLNGNGHTDLGHFESDAKTLHYQLDTKPATPSHYIHRITNGFEVKTDIDYSLMTDGSGYHKGEDAKLLDYGRGSPVVDIIAPHYLVSATHTDAPGYVAGTYQPEHQLTVE